MNDEYENLVALANLIINELPSELEHEVDRWRAALSDGISSEDMELIRQEEECWSE